MVGHDAKEGRACRGRPNTGRSSPGPSIVARDDHKLLHLSGIGRATSESRSLTVAPRGWPLAEHAQGGKDGRKHVSKFKNLDFSLILVQPHKKVVPVCLAGPNLLLAVVR